MAGVALGAETALMRVVTTVTGRAILCGRHDTVAAHRFGMAIGARQFNVAAGEGKRGLPVVVEGPGTPVARAVTGFALQTQRSRMCVVLLMTVVATFCGIMKRRRRMALLAREFGVQPDQGKPRQVVLESYAGVPQLLAMTIAAADAQLSLVRVVVGMTAPAVTGQCILHVARMTGIALQGLVCPEQRKTTG